MTAIHQALGYLFDALENLERSAEGQQRAVLKMKQREVFNATNASARVGIDPALLAKKIDSAIGKVELMLREA